MNYQKLYLLGVVMGVSMASAFALLCFTAYYLSAYAELPHYPHFVRSRIIQIP